MKVLIFCLVLGTALKLNTAEKLPSGCPPDEDPANPTHLPHATECTKFWKCWNGVPYLNECTGGLEWSIENSWCDYPQYAKCVRPLPEDGGEEGGEDGGETGGEDGGDDGSDEEVDPNLPTGCPPDEDPANPTHLPHATECTKFWKCWNGVPYLNECRNGLEWSIPNSWCDYPENAKCVRPLPEDGGENGGGEDGGEDGGDNGSEEVDPNLPTECPPDEDPANPTHLPHATECNKFWKCWNGVPHLNECPAGQHWSIQNSWCDYPENAKCVRPIPEDGGENGGDDESEEEIEFPYECPTDGNQPHATDCTKFWQCVGGVPYLTECPGGLHWSIQNNYCDYPASANCVRPLHS